jgi:hypothetical protein
MVGAVGLYVLSGVNARTEELSKPQRKIEAYRQVQHDTTSQLYSVSSVASDEFTLLSTLRQLNQFGYLCVPKTSSGLPPTSARVGIR